MNCVAFAIAAAGMTVSASSANSANIVATAQQAGSFNTLLATAQAADIKTDNGVIYVIDKVMLPSS